MKDREGGGSNFFRGLVCGALMGAGLFYFLNHTEEGKKVKKKIKKQGEEALDDLKEIIGNLEEKGKEFKEKAKEIQVQLEAKSEGEGAGKARGDLSQIEKLRARGRKAAKLFTRHGKPLNKKAS